MQNLHKAKSEDAGPGNSNPYAYKRVLRTDRLDANKMLADFNGEA